MARKESAERCIDDANQHNQPDQLLNPGMINRGIFASSHCHLHPLIMKIISVFICFFVIAACNGAPHSPKQPSALALKEVAEFPVGIAVSAVGSKTQPSFNKDLKFRQFLATHFDLVVPENEMKMEKVWGLGPDGEKDFSGIDDFIRLAGEHDLDVHGHTYIWYKDTQRKQAGKPFWLNHYSGNLESLLTGYVTEMATHFNGKLASIDVVNEGIDKIKSVDEPSPGYEFRPRNSNRWAEIYDHETKAFKAAQQADSQPIRYYNDFDLFGSASKRAKVKELVERVNRDPGVTLIQGIGLQMHIKGVVSGPKKIARDPKQLGKTIREALHDLSDLGLKLRISELEIQYDSKPKNFESKQAELYAEVIRAYKDCVPPEQQGGITFWGFRDGACQHNDCVSGSQWSHLFDENGNPKKAYFSVLQALQGNQNACLK